MEPLEATLDDCDAGPAGEEGRLSELHPRYLVREFYSFPLRQRPDPVSAPQPFMETLTTTLPDHMQTLEFCTQRMPTLHRDLTSLFSTYPEELKAKITGKANTLKGLKVAGGQAAHDLDLDRMQVTIGEVGWA